LKRGGLHNWQVGRFFAFENSADALIDGDTTPGRKSFVGGGNKIAFVAFDARGRVGCGSLPALSRTMVGPTYQKKQGGFGSRPAGLGQVSQTVNHIVSLCACFHHRARS